MTYKIARIEETDESPYYSSDLNRNWFKFDEQKGDIINSRKLSKDEIRVLALVLNSIKDDNYCETMHKITYADNEDIVILYNVIDKINLIARNIK
ncbi:MAG: hypothetical protein PHH73_02020 [Candidatus Rickettsiella isopodorum]|nr:hypothetical protein [Candidatus Rickettsiella isopodorum]